MMKTKAERFVDHVQSLLIQSRHPFAHGAAVTAAWSLLKDLEQASHATMYIPETLSSEAAARDFVRFLYDVDPVAPDPMDAPAWLRAYVIAELEMAVATHES